MKEVTKERFKEVTDRIPHYILTKLGESGIYSVDSSGQKIAKTENEKYYLIDSLAGFDLDKIKSSVVLMRKVHDLWVDGKIRHRSFRSCVNESLLKIEEQLKIK